jgi:DNA-binding transcriptional regulator LsrR (DeoR family)
MNDAQAKELLQEMRDFKMLTILQLLGTGVKQKQISQMLGVSEATMSRMIPKGLAVGRSRQMEKP